MRIKHPAKKSGHKIPRSKATQSPATPNSSSRKRKGGRTENDAPESSQRMGKKPHRFKAGTVALREIKKLQRSYNPLIPAAPFIRVVKEITTRFAPNIGRWQAEALMAIQQAAEDFVIRLFEDGMLCAIHARRVTLMKKDLELARRIGGRDRGC